MKRIIKSPALILAAALGLSACGMPFDVSRDASLDNISPVIEAPTQDWSIADYDLSVPRTLEVSEANSIKPRADIVWREDPSADRHAQVAALFVRALSEVMTPRADAATPVVVAIEVTRFHALTERARYTTGGEHEIEFILTVRHAETGAIVSGPRPVDITFRAHGGRAAIEAEAAGITQRSRILDRIRDWARTEFPAPDADFTTVAEFDG